MQSKEFEAPSDNLIILSYPPGAGGKFVSNCLCLSAGALPMAPKKQRYPSYVQKIIDRVCTGLDTPSMPEQAVSVLQQLGFSMDCSSSREISFRAKEFPLVMLRFLGKYSDVDTKLDWVSGSIPKVGAGLAGWKDLEFLPEATYGFSLGDPRFTGREHFQSQFFLELFESDLYFFTVCHRESNLAQIAQVFPGSKQIVFVNTSGWIERCVARNKPFDHQDNIPESSLCLDGAEFDVGTLFSRPRFLKAIRELYLHFDLTDFNRDAVGSFYDKYMEVHDIPTDTTGRSRN